MTPYRRTALNVAPDLDAEKMSVRAQLYLVATAAFHGTLGMFALVDPDTFQSTSYDSIRMVAPLTTWGVAMLGVSLLAALAALFRHEVTARVALLLAVLVTACWTAGFIAAATLGTLAGPSGPLVWGVLLAKDLLQCRSPMKVPLEPLVRRLADVPAPRPMTARVTTLRRKKGA